MEEFSSQMSKIFQEINFDEEKFNQKKKDRLIGGLENKISFFSR